MSHILENEFWTTKLSRVHGIKTGGDNLIHLINARKTLQYVMAMCSDDVCTQHNY